MDKDPWPLVREVSFEDGPPQEYDVTIRKNDAMILSKTVKPQQAFETVLPGSGVYTITYTAMGFAELFQVVEIRGGKILSGENQTVMLFRCRFVEMRYQHSSTGDFDGKNAKTILWPTDTGDDLLVDWGIDLGGDDQGMPVPLLSYHNWSKTNGLRVLSIPFPDVISAPKEGYKPTAGMTIAVGKTYIFRSEQSGKTLFTKMEVVAITKQRRPLARERHTNDH